jgi:ATP-dependent exoDNAse (exonuclease V) alpha subunit
VFINSDRIGEHKHPGIFELLEIRCQKEDWQRESSVEFSKLNVGTALERYEHHGKVHESSNEIHRSIAEKYLEVEQRGTVSVLCSTNEECNAINDAVRSLKKERGELGNDIIKVNGRSFAEGDRIIFLENNKESGVKNGQLGNVALHPIDNLRLYSKSHEELNMLRVILEDGRQVDIDTREYEKFNHGYAITLHKSQGKTYDNTIVLANRLMDAKATYVGMTRHRENVDLYYSKTEFRSFSDLVYSMSKYAHKDSLEDYRNMENKGI